MCAAPASAATTVGQAFAPTTSHTCAGSPAYEVVQTGVANGTSYQVPAPGGVISSWTMVAGGQDTEVALKVYRSTALASAYLIVGQDSFKTFAANSGSHTYPVRIPVQTGDYVGQIGKVGACASGTNDAADTYTSKNANTATGATTLMNTNVASGFKFAISAAVEPDVDQDGFGDESQDQCPATAGPQAGCPVPANTGSATTTSGGGTTNSAIDLVKPTLGSLGFSSTTFKAAPSGASISAKSKSKAKVGTKVSFNLSEASSVNFTVERKTKGRKVGSKCKAKRKSNAKKKSCTRWVKVPGSFTVAGKTGKNSFTFRGRVGGKSLKPGSYRLNSQATDKAKNTSPLKRKGFTIVK